MSLTNAEVRSVALSRAASASAVELAQALHVNRAASATAVELAAALQGLSMSDVQGVTAALEDREIQQQQHQYHRRP